MVQALVSDPAPTLPLLRAGSADGSHHSRAGAQGSVTVGVDWKAVALPLAWPLSASGHDIALLAGLGFGQLAVPCVLAVVCARVLSAPEVSLLALLEVIFGIVWAWLWANETPGREVLLGGSVVIAALLINELAARTASPSWLTLAAMPAKCAAFSGSPGAIIAQASIKI